MRTAPIVLGAVVAFLIGAAVGGLAGWSHTAGDTAKVMANSAAAGVGNKTSILRSVHEGDTKKAMQLLEITLDSDLVTLGLVPPSVLDPAMKRAIARAAGYRAKHPYVSDEPVVAEAVARVLADHATMERQAK